MEKIGGQAVIEGVMMKSRKGWTVAVRGPKGDIYVKKELLGSIPKILMLPIIRGVVAIYQALSLGVKAIEYSAKKAFEEEDKRSSGSLYLSLTIGFSFLLGIALFILLPLYATRLLGIIFPYISKSTFMFNLVDGIIRVFIFLLYLIGVGMWKEMKRIFEYHGAEHKVIHAYENRRRLIVKEVKDYSTCHLRCGTSFLLIVMVVSVLVFSIIPRDWSYINKFLSRLILIPAIAGISFEFLKFASKMKDNLLVNIIVQPGLMLQRLTTREPDDSQIEVAIRALEEVLKIEEPNDQKT
ncbi:MAG: DUF1385 domain-containing protein [Thermodesulfovibrionales bacterium]